MHSSMTAAINIKSSNLIPNIGSYSTNNLESPLILHNFAKATTVKVIATLKQNLRSKLGTRAHPLTPIPEEEL